VEERNQNQDGSCNDQQDQDATTGQCVHEV
jgi:hypothetical protein